MKLSMILAAVALASSALPALADAQYKRWQNESGYADCVTMAFMKDRKKGLSFGESMKDAKQNSCAVQERNALAKSSPIAVEAIDQALAEVLSQMDDGRTY